jgi:photosystem II stability/assembly factor-like uncharacterized protein
MRTLFLVVVVASAVSSASAGNHRPPGLHVFNGGRGDAPFRLGSSGWVSVGPREPVPLRVVAAAPDGLVLYAVARDEPTLFRSTDGGAHWSLRGGLPLEPQQLAVDPLDSDRLLAASPGGIFFSRDQGSTWLRATGALAADTRSVLFDPDGEFAFALASGRILRSSDHGETWQQLTLTESFASLSAGPSGLVLAGTAGGGGGRVLLSRDAGATWTALLSGIHGEISSVSIPSDKYLYAATYGAVARSSDGGTTWQTAAGPGGGDHVVSVVADQKTPTTVFLLQTFAGVWKSIDAANSWRLTNPYPAVEAPLSLQIVDSTPWLVYANIGAGGGLFASADGGYSWRGAGPNRSVNALDLVVHGREGLYVMADTDVYHSDDRGRTWERVGVGSGANAIAVARNGTMYAAMGGRGIWKKPPDGPLRGLAGPPPDSDVDVQVAPTNPREVFVTGEIGGDDSDYGWRSLDGGRTWTSLRPSVSGDSFVIDPHNARIVYATDTRVRKSTDSGSTWRITTAYEPRSDGFSMLRIDARATNSVYVCRANGQLLRSENAAATWRQAAAIPDGISSFQPDPTSARRVWAVSTDAVLYRSDNAARSWRRLGHLPGTGRLRICNDWSTPRVVIDPATQSLYLLAQDGLYRKPLSASRG